MNQLESSPIPLDLVRKANCARDKVKNLSDLKKIADAAHLRKNTIVLAHGVFDLVHMGHVRHLEAAKREGDYLIVTITPDEFVNKGPGRPVFSSQIRAEMLAALECVDWVGINYWSSAEKLIELISPDFYVKGSDYTNEGEDLTGKISLEREAVENCGGKTIFTDDITFSSS